MTEITVLDETFPVTDAEKAAFDKLVDAGVDELTAARIATSSFEDMEPVR